MHTNVKSLGCTPDTNIMVYVSYTSIKKRMAAVTCEQAEGYAREPRVGGKHKALRPVIGTPNGLPGREGRPRIWLFAPLRKGNEEAVLSPALFPSFCSVSAISRASERCVVHIKSNNVLIERC